MTITATSDGLVGVGLIALLAFAIASRLKYPAAPTTNSKEPDLTTPHPLPPRLS